MRPVGIAVVTLSIALGACGDGGRKGPVGGSPQGGAGAEGGSGGSGSGGSAGGGAGGASRDAGPAGGAGGSSGNGGSGGGGGSGGPAGPDAGKDGPGVAPAGDGGPSVPVPDELPPCQRTVAVSDTGGLGAALQMAAAGDCLVLADGTYTAPTISAKGTTAHPIIVRAANRGKATFNGGQLVLRGAADVVVEGFAFEGGATGNIGDSTRCRISRSRFRLGGGDWVAVTGMSDTNRIDHNDLGPLTSNGHLVHPTGFSTNTRVDHNYLHDVSPAGGNGRETISLGCCGATYDYHDTFNVVEHNLLVNCSGENEMIGLKSSSNTVRYNTIRQSAGFISLRAGRKNKIYGNYILGAGKGGAGGIRVFEDDHIIYNNYIESQDTPIILANGDPPGGGHAAIERVTVVFNTFVVRGAPVQIGGEAHNVPPSGTIFSNNLLFGTGAVFNERNPSGVTYQGNIAFGGGAGTGVTKPTEQFKVVDPQLMKVGDIFRPSASSPVVGAAIGSSPFVTEDIDGQPRPKPDVGADQVGAAGRGPLTPADVGPDAP
jgi:poly(beta-D-mannuronate) lyase